MSIDKNRDDFLAVLGIALLSISVISPTQLTFIACLLFAICGLILFFIPEQGAGYALGGLAVTGSGATAVIGISTWTTWPPLATSAVALSVMILTTLGLIRSWSARTPVRYGQQVNINSIFGARKIRGPTRIRRPIAWLGSRMISTISLRTIKDTLQVKEIDIRPALAPTGTTLRVIRPETIDPVIDHSPTKIHAIELVVSWSIDGDQWFLLNEIPHQKAYAAELAPHVAHDQPEYAEAIVTGYIREEAPEVLRRVIQHEGWAAATVRDDREKVARYVLAELRAEAAKMGVIAHQVELLTVDIDAPEALRAARNNNVYGLEAIERLERVGQIKISQQRDVIHSMQELLSSPDHRISAEVAAALARTQIRALGPTTPPITILEDLLEETLPSQHDTPRRKSHHHRDAA